MIRAIISPCIMFLLALAVAYFSYLMAGLQIAIVAFICTFSAMGGTVLILMLTEVE